MDEFCDKTITVLNNLLAKGFDISYYREAILAVDTYSDAHLQLLSHLWSENCPKRRRLDKEQIANILTQMDSSGVDHGDFLVKEAKSNELFKEQLLIHLEGKPVENLALLKNELRCFVVKKFEEKFDDYKQNEAILTLIATSGTETGIHKLVNLICTKLMEGENIKYWTSLIYKMREIEKKESNQLTSTIENLSDSLCSDTEKASMKDAISKITHL